MSPLGRFGGTSTDRLRTSSGGGATSGSEVAGRALVDQALERLLPSTQGQPTATPQLGLLLANYAQNRVVNGSFEALEVTEVANTTVTIAGTISSSGTTVTGSSTVFTTALAVNDLLIAFNVTTNTTEIRRVTAIATDTSLTVESAFSTNLGAGSLWTRARTFRGWTLTGSSSYIERDTTNVQDGLAACELTAATNTATDLAQSLTISATQNTRLRGREATFSARVLASTADRVFLKVDDGVLTQSSRFHVGDGTFETLQVTITVDAAATKLEVSLEISSGASIAATFDSAMLVEGASAVAFSPHPGDGTLQNRVTYAATTTTTISTTGEQLDSMIILGVVLDGNQSVLAAINVPQSKLATAAGVVTYTLRRHNTDVVNGTNKINQPVIVDIFTVGFACMDIKPAAGLYSYRMIWATPANTLTNQERGLTLAVLPSA